MEEMKIESEKKQEYGGCLSTLLPIWAFSSVLVILYNLFIIFTSLDEVNCVIAVSLLTISDIIGLVGIIYLMKFKALGFYLSIATTIIGLVIAGIWPEYMLDENPQVRSILGFALICILLSIKNNGVNGFQMLGITGPKEKDLNPKVASEETTKDKIVAVEYSVEETPVVEGATVIEETPVIEKQISSPIVEMSSTIEEVHTTTIQEKEEFVIEDKVKKEPVSSSSAESEDNPKKIPFKIPTLDLSLFIYSGFLFACLLDLPYGYYILVRYAGMVLFACVAYEAICAKNKALAVLGCAVAFLFQPFYKIDLGREVWNIVDVVVAVIIIVAVIVRFILSRKSNPEGNS